MADVLKDYAEKADCEEVYEVVKTAVVVKDGKTYRVEVWKSYSNPSMPYIASCCVEEEIEEKTVWVDFPLASTDRDDVDGTLVQALSFLPNAQRATA
jgi:hypothetical protein